MKKIISAMLVIVMVFLMGTVSFAGSYGWQVNKTGWWYLFKDGSYAADEWLYDNGDWYHFNAEGYMQTGWVSDGGNWYYLDTDGAMVVGWVYNDDSWYYMKQDGTMAVGWLYTLGVWYYFESDGTMVTGTREIDGVIYHFDNYGRMLYEGGNTPAPVYLEANEDEVTIILDQKYGWYVARLLICLENKVTGYHEYYYTDSCAMGQQAAFAVDTSVYDIEGISLQTWAFEWVNRVYYDWEYRLVQDCSSATFETGGSLFSPTFNIWFTE